MIKQKAFFGHAGRPGQVGGSVPRSGISGGQPDQSAAQKLANDYYLKFTEKYRGEHSNHNRYLTAAVAQELALASGTTTDDVNMVLERWVYTANSGRKALNIQRNFAEELGLELSDWQKQQISTTDFTTPLKQYDFETSAENEKKIARSMYENTQNKLKELGYDENDVITLYRGVVHEGVTYEKGSVVEYHGNAMESWTMSPNTAREFAEGSYADPSNTAVFSMKVPVKNIIGAYFSGLGLPTEHEFVVMGNIAGQQAFVVDTELRAEKSFPGHAGRPGQVGGSVPRSGGAAVAARRAGKAGKRIKDIQYFRNNYDELSRIRTNALENFTKDKLHGQGDAGLKHNIVSAISQRTGIHYKKVNQFIRNWSVSANDTDPRALNIQKDAAEELGLELSYWQKEKMRDMRGVRNPEELENRVVPKDDQKRLIRAMYEMTQERLQQMGYKDSVVVYRGSGTKELLPVKTKINYRGNAVESWSISYGAASMFEHEYNSSTLGASFAMEVPTKNVIGTWFSGFGCAKEFEFLVMGNIPGQEAWVVSTTVH